MSSRRVAWSVVAWVATRRTKLRLPLAQLRWLLERGWGLRLAVGEVAALLAEAARAGQPAYEALLGEARVSPVVHIDETGWRENGRNGWVWTLTTPTLHLVQYAHSRAGAVAARLLGEESTAMVVSDFYGAYDQLERTQQRCWAHLLRDIHDLIAAHPGERGLRPLVIARKISGGTRSARGTTTRMVLQSLVATWELRGLDPVTEFLALLRAPRPTVEIAPV